MAKENNTIPLYINSIDRVNISDSTTNFTVALRKSLRNVASLAVGKVVIPKSATMINTSNNTLTGQFIVSSVSTLFSITITNGTYTEVSLATELNTQFNANVITSLFDLTWVITYNNATERIEIDLTYPNGPLFTWSVVFNYSELINVIGLGSPGTISQTFTPVGVTDELNIPCTRKPTLTNPLLYSITSNELTQSINTSYMKSLAKNFNISSTNNTIGIDATITAVDINQPLPLGTGTETTSTPESTVAMSDNGNVIACSSNLNGFMVFEKAVSGEFWVQRINQISDGFSGDPIAISGDGNTIAIGSPNANNFDGEVNIYIKIGYSWVHQDTLIGTPTSASFQGSSVSLSTDGNTLAVGAPSDNSGVGATWIWTRTGTIWTQQDKLIGSIGLVGLSFQGSSVALSGNGDVVVIGAPKNNSDEGCIWVFTRSASIWTEHNQYIGSGGLVNSEQGNKVAISTSGNTIAFAGGTTDDSVWVFEFSSPNWVEEDKIIGTGNIGTAFQGSSISLADGGNKLAVGGFGNDGGVGAVWIHTRTGSTWSQQEIVTSSRASFISQGYSTAMSSDGLILSISGRIPGLILGAVDIFKLDGGTFSSFQELSATGSVATVRQGSSVKISANGNIAVIGATDDGDGLGATWVYEKSGLSWIQKQKLVGSSAVGLSNQGTSLALSSDGSTIVVGGSLDDSGKGAVWVFIKQGDSWIELQKIIATSTAGATQGSAVAINSDGSNIAIGAPLDNSGIGAVFVFNLENGLYIEKQKLIGSFPLEVSNRGVSVDIVGDTLVFGGSTYLINGLVWVFKLQTQFIPPNTINTQWEEETTLFGSNVIGNIINPAKFGNSVSISGDEKTIAIGSIGDNLDNGAVWIFRLETQFIPPNTINTQWEENTKLIEVSQRYGNGVSLNRDGTKLIVGTDKDFPDIGEVFIHKEINSVWSQGVKKLASGYDSIKFGASVSGSLDGEYLVGAPLTQINVGRVSYLAPEITLDTQFDIIIDDGVYTIFDLENSLTRSIDNYLSFIATFDGTSVFTLTGVLTANITSFIFNVQDGSTFDPIIWTSRIKANLQPTSIIDFTINNDVMKIILNNDTSLLSTTFIVNDIFRKYPPGFTIDDGQLIDVQLRDERDRIIDLNGQNWFMEILATIYS